MSEYRNIKISEVAILMGKSELFIREAMRRGLMDIGVAMQLEGSQRWNFHISPRDLASYLGITVDELWELLDKERADEAS